MSDIQEKIMDELMTPVELANHLEMNGCFCADQAGIIAAEVYQPLPEIIKLLAERSR